MHYKSFDEAKAKWEERKKRVSYDNLFVIQTIQNASLDDISSFEQIPFENKMLICGNNASSSPCVRYHPIFNKKNYRAGEVLGYRSKYAIKRNMDKIDYVGFLNRE